MLEVGLMILGMMKLSKESWKGVNMKNNFFDILCQLTSLCSFKKTLFVHKNVIIIL